MTRPRVSAHLASEPRNLHDEGMMIGKMKAFGAGFLLGIFVAPRSGAASRQLLMDRLAEFFENGERNFEELEGDLAERRRTTGGLRETDWPEVDESMIGEPETGSGA